MRRLIMRKIRANDDTKGKVWDMPTSAQIIRDEIEEGLEDNETTAIVSVEFAQAFTLNLHTEREIYHVILTHEYSRETRLEVIRVTIDNYDRIVEMERVYAS